MPSWLRSVLVAVAILASAMAGSWLLGVVLQRLPLIATPLVIVGGISAALWWRVRWSIKNPLPPSDTTDGW